MFTLHFVKYNIFWCLILLYSCCMYAEIPFSVFDGQSSKKDFTSVVRSITKSGSWKMRDGGIYNPAVSGPVMQVKSSGVTLDLQNYSLQCNTQSDQLVTAIEIGYSKAELDADPSLRQVSNVTIKNGCFIDFDVGIAVHQGVNTLTIENCNFDGVSVGIVFLGTSSKKHGSTIGVTIKNTIILGHGLDKQEKLVMLKERFEGASNDRSYAYGKDTFMPLVKDTLQDDFQNVYTYGGIVANYVYGFNVENVRIQNMGYRNYASQSEGNGRRTAVVGIYCNRCADVSIEKAYMFSNFSEISAIGIQLHYIRNVNLKDLDIIYQRSTCKSCGIEALDPESLLQSQEDFLFTRERTISFDNVRCVLTLSRKTDLTPTATECSAGVCVQGIFSIQARKLLCEGINGEKRSYGLHAVGLMNSNFEDCSFNKNKSNRSENDVVDGYGIVAAGAYVSNSNGILFKGCDFSNNIGKNTGIGLLLESVTNIDCKDSTYSGNKGLTYKKDETADYSVDNSIRKQQDSQEVSNHGPVVSSAQTGGYGFIVDTCQRLAVKACEAKNNSGHRSIGYLLKNSGVITLEDSDSYYQYAYGDFVHTDIQRKQEGGVVDNNGDVPILDVHRPLLFDIIFSDRFKDDSLNIRTITDKLLHLSKNIRESWNSQVAVPSSQERLLVKCLSYIVSLLSRFRLWGVAYGLQMHNCKGMLIKNSRFGGQISEKDSAAGIVLTGRCSDFYLEESEMSYNYGWTNSVARESLSGADYDYYYNLLAILPFWNTVIKSFDKAKSEVSFGFIKTSDALTAQGQRELDGSGNDMSVVIHKKEHPFMNVFAPVSSGLVIGDSCQGGTILKNKFHGNKGFAGYCMGLLFHMAENFLVQENVIDDNGSNIYGHCLGILDLNLYSENSYVDNSLAFNRVDGYYNSHSLVISDTRSNTSAVYPKVKLNNGISVNSQAGVDNKESMFPTVGKKEKKLSKKRHDDD